MGHYPMVFLRYGVPNKTIFIQILDLNLVSPKGAHSWTDWKGHSKMGEVPVNVRMEMLEKEKQAREALKVAIEERLKK